MNIEKKEKVGEAWWKPAMVFYAKTTGWVIAPAILALIITNYFKDTFGGNTVFLTLIFGAFLITCFGIYREVKIYKKDLERAEKEKNNGNK